MAFIPPRRILGQSPWTLIGWGLLVATIAGMSAAYFAFATGEELARRSVKNQAVVLEFTPTESIVELWAEIDVDLPIDYHPEEDNWEDVAPPLLRYVIVAEQDGDQLDDMTCDPFREDLGNWETITPADGDPLGLKGKSRLQFDARMHGCRLKVKPGLPVHLEVHREWLDKDWAKFRRTDIIVRGPHQLF